MNNFTIIVFLIFSTGASKIFAQTIETCRFPKNEYIKFYRGGGEAAYILPQGTIMFKSCFWWSGNRHAECDSNVIGNAVLFPNYKLVIQDVTLLGKPEVTISLYYLPDSNSYNIITLYKNAICKNF